jgi:hypothetical protein
LLCLCGCPLCSASVASTLFSVPFMHRVHNSVACAALRPHCWVTFTVSIPAVCQIPIAVTCIFLSPPCSVSPLWGFDLSFPHLRCSESPLYGLFLLFLLLCAQNPRCWGWV